MINQEPGALPGPGLTVLETFTYFVAAPVTLFIGISIIAWIFSGEKKKKSSGSASVVTSIE